VYIASLHNITADYNHTAAQNIALTFFWLIFGVLDSSRSGCLLLISVGRFISSPVPVHLDVHSTIKRHFDHLLIKSTIFAILLVSFLLIQLKYIIPSTLKWLSNAKPLCWVLRYYYLWLHFPTTWS